MIKALITAMGLAVVFAFMAGYYTHWSLHQIEVAISIYRNGHEDGKS